MKNPKIHPSATVFPGAVVLGDVELMEDSSLWFGAVVRAEYESLTIGRRSNVQDNCVIHVDTGHPCRIGDDVTIGHGAILLGCTIGDNTLVGMGAVVLNDAVIGENCIIGARALVTGGKVFPAGSLIMGVPAKVVRPLTEEEMESNRASAEHYVRSSREVATHLAQHPLKER